MFFKYFSVLHHTNYVDKMGFDNKMIWILSNGALCNISFPCALGKMTLRENLTIESWENRKLHDLQEKNEIKVMVELGRHDLQEKNEIKVMGNPERPWPTGEKWNQGHSGTGKTMTYRRKMRSRPWGNWKGHDLQEKNEIQAIGNPERSWPTGEKWNSDHRENGNNMIWRFCLFRINLYLKWNFKKQFKKLQKNCWHLFLSKI